MSLIDFENVAVGKSDVKSDDKNTNKTIDKVSLMLPNLFYLIQENNH